MPPGSDFRRVIPERIEGEEARKTFFHQQSKCHWIAKRRGTDLKHVLVQKTRVHDTSNLKCKMQYSFLKCTIL